MNAENRLDSIPSAEGIRKNVYSFFPEARQRKRKGLRNSLLREKTGLPVPRGTETADGTAGEN